MAKSNNQNLWIWGGLAVLAFFLFTGRFNLGTKLMPSSYDQSSDVFDQGSYAAPEEPNNAGSFDDFNAPEQSDNIVTGQIINPPQGTLMSRDDNSTPLYPVVGYTRTARTWPNGSVMETCYNNDGFNIYNGAYWAFNDFGPFTSNNFGGVGTFLSGKEQCLDATHLLEVVCTKDEKVTVTYTDGRKKVFGPGWVFAANVDCVAEGRVKCDVDRYGYGRCY